VPRRRSCANSSSTIVCSRSRNLCACLPRLTRTSPRRHLPRAQRPPGCAQRTPHRAARSRERAALFATCNASGPLRCNKQCCVVISSDRVEPQAARRRDARPAAALQGTRTRTHTPAARLRRAVPRGDATALIACNRKMQRNSLQQASDQPRVGRVAAWRRRTASHRIASHRVASHRLAIDSDLATGGPSSGLCRRQCAAGH
jgi:hypothetical protein